MQRMAETERTGHARNEHVERHGRGVRRLGRPALFVGGVTGEVMAACRQQQIVEAEVLDLGDTPGRDPLAAHLVLKGVRLFEEQDRVTGPGHDDGERAAGDAAADDDQIVRAVHDAPRGFGTVRRSLVAPSGLSIKPGGNPDDPFRNHSHRVVLSLRAHGAMVSRAGGDTGLGPEHPPQRESPKIAPAVPRRARTLWGLRAACPFNPCPTAGPAPRRRSGRASPGRRPALRRVRRGAQGWRGRSRSARRRGR